MIKPSAARRSALAIVASIALACGIAGPARAAEPYEIDVVLPLTGFAAFVGQGVATSLSIIKELTNKRGGIRGRPIHFVVADDQSSPQVAVQLTNAIVAKKPPLLLGSTISAMCQAQGPIVKDGPVQMCFSPVIRPPAGSFVFTTLHTTDDNIEVLLRYARARGWTKIATLAPTDASGVDFDQSFERVMAKPEQTGIAVVDREKMANTDLSVAAQIAKIKASGAQGLFGWAAGTPIGTILRAMTDAGLDIPVFTTPANLNWPQMRTLSSVMPNDFYFPGNVSYAPDIAPSGPVRQAVFQYREALQSHKLVPDNSYLAGWDPTLIALAGLQKLGLDTTPEKLRAFIASYKGDGALGHFDYAANPQRGTSTATLLVLRWDKGRTDWAAVSKFGGEPLKQ